MSLFQLARKPPKWLRVALAGLLLAFALNAIAHVSHWHDATTMSVAHSVACNYCVSFGGLADAPRHTHARTVTELSGVALTPAVELEVTLRPQTSARPRAPPV